MRLRSRAGRWHWTALIALVACRSEAKPSPAMSTVAAADGPGPSASGFAAPNPDAGATRDADATPVASAAPAPRDDTCRKIARAIEAAKANHPALVEFDASLYAQRPCKISYAYRCHPSTIRGGWRAQVPEPDPDGVWFYIGLWDPSDPNESESQINTQPGDLPHYIGTHRVTFLSWTGAKASSVSGALRTILKAQGMR